KGRGRVHVPSFDTEQRMVRRIALGVCVLSVIAIVLMLADPVNRIKVMGRLHGESFHSGHFVREMPLSFWLTALDSPNGDLRYDALLAVRHEKAAIPGLIRRLEDKVALLRTMAALDLSDFGAEAKEAVPGLGVMLKDEDRSCRQAARDALLQ